MDKNLLAVLIFLLVLVVYLSLQTEIKIEALGGFFQPVFSIVILAMLGKKARSLFMPKGEEKK